MRIPISPVRWLTSSGGRVSVEQHPDVCHHADDAPGLSQNGEFLVDRVLARKEVAGQGLADHDDLSRLSVDHGEDDGRGADPQRQRHEAGCEIARRLQQRVKPILS